MIKYSVPGVDGAAKRARAEETKKKDLVRHCRRRVRQAARRKSGDRGTAEVPFERGANVYG